MEDKNKNLSNIISKKFDYIYSYINKIDIHV